MACLHPTRFKEERRETIVLCDSVHCRVGGVGVEQHCSRRKKQREKQNRTMPKRRLDERSLATAEWQSRRRGTCTSFWMIGRVDSAPQGRFAPSPTTLPPPASSTTTAYHLPSSASRLIAGCPHTTLRPLTPPGIQDHRNAARTPKLLSCPRTSFPSSPSTSGAKPQVRPSAGP